MKLSTFNPLSRLRLWQKFTVLGALALAAVAVPYVQFYQTANEGIAFARTELSGLPTVQSMTGLVQLLQQHRGLASVVLGGDDSQATARAAKQSEVEQAFAAVDKQLVGIDAKSVKDEWSTVKQGWRQIASDSASRSSDARKNFAAHTALLARAITFIETLGDQYKLTLDPISHTYFLVQAALVQLPNLAEETGQLRGLGAGRLTELARLRVAGSDTNAAFTAADRAQLEFLLRSAEQAAAGSYRFVAKAIESEPRLRTLLESEMSVPQEAMRQVAQVVRKELLDSPTPTLAAAVYFKTLTDGIDAQYKFLARVEDVLGQELTRYSGTLRRDQLMTSAEILAVALLVTLIAALTLRNITGTVSRLQASVEKVRGGDFDALQAIDAKDEVGDLGRTVNSLLQERIAAQHKAEAENDTLNNSVISILQAVNQLSQRDLTAKAPVTQDIIGTVSDSINALTDETSKVLSGVTRIANEVESASGKVKTQADLVFQTASDERANVGLMIKSLGESTASMNRMSALADQSNVSAEQATRATSTALDTVNGTVKGMESIRETIAETEKRIKRLGERSQEITGIVNLISTISERTHVLALNASMQAAVAGEAGRGFAVVAEEVQRLAESSRNATLQIGTLVSNIQLETNETINTVNRTITQVVHGSEQAQKAGDQMRLTQDITAQLVAQVKQIAEGSNLQRKMSMQLLESVEDVGKSTERTAAHIGAQNAETDSLMLSARRLVESVNVFKLLPSAA